MTKPPMDSEITKILQDMSDGDESARAQLLPLVYDELRRQARAAMASERGEHTLQPTALVHEVFLKMSKQGQIKWKDRRHFYGFTARMMREILIDHARKHATVKRGNRPMHLSLDEVQIPVEDRAASILELDAILRELEKMDPRQARIVEMRFFGGMTISEIAEALGISDRTVGREWESARLWLYRELNG